MTGTVRAPCRASNRAGTRSGCSSSQATVARRRVATCGGVAASAITSPRETSMSVSRCSVTLSGADAASRSSPSTSMRAIRLVAPEGSATISSPTVTTPLSMRPARPRMSCSPSSWRTTHWTGMRKAVSATGGSRS